MVLDMTRILLTATAALLAGTAAAPAQVTTPTPGQPGAQVAPGTPNSSDRDPNNPAASRDAEKSPTGTTGSGTRTRGVAPGNSGENNLTGPATSPAEKSPQRNDPTPDRQENTP